jgi:DNA repair protein RecN (Recombination protein N)
MLRHLSIRDFVIVAALDIEFDAGFSVFSGETGAGKSILVDALALTLGARADTGGVVRTGQQRADITAEFATSAQSEHWLAEHALDGGAADHGSVLLRRAIDAGGRSRAFINGMPATLTQLREIGEMLVDIHGQHAHQLLMRAEAQRDLFDTHSGLSASSAAVALAWRAWRDAGATTQPRTDASANCNLNANAWLGSYPNSTSWRRKLGNGKKSMPSTAACRTRRA